MRKKVRPGPDKRKFTRTASHVKAINLPVTVYRGGIRL